MSTFDAIVIGAGIVGAGTAFALARMGSRVALLDAGPIGSTPGETGGTSRASFAWLNATAKIDGEDYHRLNADGLEHYRTLAREFGEGRLGLHPTGMIAWADAGDEARRRALHAQVARLRKWSYPVTPLDERGLRALEPHVDFAPGVEGLLAWADAWLDVPRAVDLLCEQVRRDRGTVVSGERGRVAGLLRDETGAVRGVEAGGARFAAPVVVAALGPDTEIALRTWLGPGKLGNRPFLGRRPGLLVDTPDTGPFRLVRHVLYSGDNAFHLRPGPSGSLRIGSEDADPESEAPGDAAARAVALLVRARALLPGLGGGAPVEDLARESTVSIGVRPVPADDRAIVGPVADAPGLYVVATHSGVTLGPWIGRLAAEEITSGTMPDQLAPFRFDRFA